MTHITVKCFLNDQSILFTGVQNRRSIYCRLDYIKVDFLMNLATYNDGGTGKLKKKHVSQGFINVDFPIELIGCPAKTKAFFEGVASRLAAIGNTMEDIDGPENQLF